MHAGEGSGCRLVFDSSDACTAKEGKPDPATAKGVTASGEFWSGIVSQLKAVVEVSAKSELSPDFTNYRLARQGDPSASTLDVEINDDVFASEGFTNDGGAGADFEGGEFGADAGFDDDDDNDDDNDCGGDFGGGYDDVMVPEAGPSVGDMAVAAAGSASDYSFFDASTMSSAPGAGAGHWKAQRAKKTKAEKEEEAAEKKQDKGSKFLIDFENLDDKAIAKAMAPSKTSTTLSAANIEGATEESTTLPDDLHYQFNTLLSLFTKPELVMRRAGSAGDDDAPSAAGGWYDFTRIPAVNPLRNLRCSSCSNPLLGTTTTMRTTRTLWAAATAAAPTTTTTTGDLMPTMRLTTGLRALSWAPPAPAAWWTRLSGRRRCG